MRLVDRENFYCNKKEVSRKKIKERKKKDERKMGWLITRVETQQAGSQRSRINLNCIGHAERERNEAEIVRLRLIDRDQRIDASRHSWSRNRSAMLE